MKAKRDISSLSFVLGRHADRMSAKMFAEREAYPDLKHEVRFFVGTGFYKVLAKDTGKISGSAFPQFDGKTFAQAWNLWRIMRERPPADPAIIAQAWQLDGDLEMYERACGIYQAKGVMMPAATPWDVPADDSEEVEEDVVEA